MRRIAVLAAAVAAIWAALPATAWAQSSRTYVSGTGRGTLCTLTAPCATFQAAHDTTAPRGVLTCLDAGEYGPVNITKSITIDCVATGATILGNTFGGVFIQSPDPAPVVVRLRGLTIDGGRAGRAGIRMVTGGVLHVEHCRIFGFTHHGHTAAGILLDPLIGLRLDASIADTIVTGNGFSAGASPHAGGGILVNGGGPAHVVLERVRIAHNDSVGLRVSTLGSDPAVVLVRDSVIEGNAREGIEVRADTNAAVARVSLDRTSVIMNGGVGIAALDNALVTIGSATIVGNGSAYDIARTARVVSYQNNQTDGTPTGALTLR